MLFGNTQTTRNFKKPLPNLFMYRMPLMTAPLFLIYKLRVLKMMPVRVNLFCIKYFKVLTPSPSPKERGARRILYSKKPRLNLEPGLFTSLCWLLRQDGSPRFVRNNKRRLTYPTHYFSAPFRSLTTTPWASFASGTTAAMPKNSCVVPS